MALGAALYSSATPSDGRRRRLLVHDASCPRLTASHEKNLFSNPPGRPFRRTSMTANNVETRVRRRACAENSLVFGRCPSGSSQGRRCFLAKDEPESWTAPFGDRRWQAGTPRRETNTQLVALPARHRSSSSDSRRFGDPPPHP